MTSYGRRAIGLFAFILGVALVALIVIAAREGFLFQDRMVAALTTLCGAFLGLYVGYWRWRLGQRERDREVVMALKTEVEIGFYAYLAAYDFDTREHRRETFIENISNDSRNPTSFPIGLSTAQNYVFDNLRGELPRLRDATIRAVITYYQADDAYNRLVAGFADGRFEARSRESKSKLIYDFFAIEERALWAAFQAYGALEAELRQRDFKLAPWIRDFSARDATRAAQLQRVFSDRLDAAREGASNAVLSTFKRPGE